MNSFQHGPLWAAAGSIVLLTTINARGAGANAFEVEALVSDVPGLADHHDPNLVNPWGLAASPTSPFWVANNGTGTATLYNGEGEPLPQPTPLVVAVLGQQGAPASPTGIVFNGGSGFELNPEQPARFLFATEEGTVSGWNPGANLTQTILKVDQSGAGAAYKGLAIGNNGSGDFLYAADFGGGKIDVFDSGFSAATLSGSFSNPTLPSGFAPFNIQNIGGELFVTYAKTESGGIDDVPGPGNGYVAVFDLNGNLLRNLISQGALNSPWGLEIAPDGFGSFGGNLLVGNFGDGKINVYDRVSGAYLDTLKDEDGNAIMIEGLWALKTGNGGQGGDEDDLYFTAGIAAGASIEDHGVFGEISTSDVPDGGASTRSLLGAALIGIAAARRRKQ